MELLTVSDLADILTLLLFTALNPVNAPRQLTWAASALLGHRLQQNDCRVVQDPLMEKVWPAEAVRSGCL